MSLEEFLHNLHFNTDKASQPDWKVDWEDAPLAYKLYQGLPVFSFSLEVPLSLEVWESPSEPDFLRIGHFLWYVFGLTQFSQTVYTLDSTEQTADLMESYRRFVPSGGALYPNELYVYLKIEDLPAGVYHYDVAHHRLVMLREGNFDSYLADALGNRYDMSSCFGAVFVSTMFWKNFYKYHNFSYRLQGLDAGVLIGQLLEVAKRFGFETGVYFQFLDRAINHLLGLSEHEESVYSIIPLTVEPTIWSTLGSNVDRIVTAEELCRELPAIHPKHYVRSKRVLEYPMLTNINKESMFNSTRSIQQQIKWNGSMTSEGESVARPHVKVQSYDLASVCRQRFSPDMDFVMGEISQQQLATLLRDTMDTFSYRNDLDTAYKKLESRVSLYVCLNNVEGIPAGAYCYDSDSHVLRQINIGDYRLQLQYGLFGGNVNLYQVPLCLHVVGGIDHYKSALGYRGYRIQQMEAGMLVQRLLLTATAIGMGGHPLLGYNVNSTDRIYKLEPQEKTSLIQIPIGPYRNRPWLRGSLQS
jgi:SagB-type dehydrogenase family enzyme